MLVDRSGLSRSSPPPSFPLSSIQNPNDSLPTSPPNPRPPTPSENPSRPPSPSPSLPLSASRTSPTLPLPPPSTSLPNKPLRRLLTSRRRLLLLPVGSRLLVQPSPLLHPWQLLFLPLLERGGEVNRCTLLCPLLELLCRHLKARETGW